MLANKVVPNLETSNQADYLKLVGLLTALISLLAIFQISQLPQNLPNNLLLQPGFLVPTEYELNGPNKTEPTLRVGLKPDIGHHQALESLHRARRSLLLQEGEEIDALRPGHNQLETLEGLVIPAGSEPRKTRSNLGEDVANHQPLLVNLYRAEQQQRHPPPDYFQPTYYSMSMGEPNEVYQQQQQAVANLVDDDELINMMPPVDEPIQGDISRKMNKQFHHQEAAEVDVTNQVPESYDHLVKDNILPVNMMAHDSYEPPSMVNQINPAKPAMAQSSNYQPTSKIAEFRHGQEHVMPIHSADLNTAAGHYYGKKKHHTYVKKKIYLVKAKKKKVIIIKKAKKKKKRKHHHHHQGDGHQHYGHGKYYMYAKVPKKKSWESGHKRGNKKHLVERHEKGHKNKFKTQVKWHDAKSKGKGHHIWDYNHHDKKKKKHYG